MLHLFLNKQYRVHAVFKMSCIEEKRVRAPNYSADEKIRLLNIIANKKGIIENKTTDAVTWQQKENAWKDVANEFNAGSLTKRTVASIKGFYENQKRSCHKLAATQNRNIVATGGGPATDMSNDPVFNMMMSIVNKKTVFGMETPFGGDAQTQPTTGPLKFVSCTNADNDADLDIDHNYCNVEEVEIFDEQDDDVEPEEAPINWSRYSAHSHLKTPVNKKLLPRHKRTNTDKEYTTTNKDEANNLTATKKMKLPTMKVNDSFSSRRRPAMSATASVARSYEDLCAVKKELAETQLRILQTFETYQKAKIKELEEETKIRRERETELYLIDVAIKKTQLHQL